MGVGRSGLLPMKDWCIRVHGVTPPVASVGSVGVTPMFNWVRSTSRHQTERVLSVLSC